MKMIEMSLSVYRVRLMVETILRSQMNLEELKMKRMFFCINYQKLDFWEFQELRILSFKPYKFFLKSKSISILKT